MKSIKLFHLTNCPYCHNARRALDELRQENPKYADISVEWIEENEQSDFAAQYDYYYVPTVFFGGEKLYEADPSEDYADCKSKMKAAFDAVLEKN